MVIISTILVIVGTLYFLNKFRINKLRRYNSEYITNYFKDNLDNCTVEKVEKYIHVSDFLGNTHLEMVDTDNVDKMYTEKYYIYDNDLDYRYELVFEHNSYDVISMISNMDKQYYVDRKNKYLDNYSKIEEIIKNNSGESVLLSNYKDDEIGQYILLVYVPDIDTAVNIQNTLYNNIYGARVTEDLSVTNGIDIGFPRYIFVNDIGTFNMLKNKSENVLEYIYEKQLKCSDSLVTEYTKDNYILISDIVNILFNKPMEYNRLYTRNTTLTLEDDELHNKWCIVFQLEVGVDYYTDVYNLD